MKHTSLSTRLGTQKQRFCNKKPKQKLGRAVIVHLHILICKSDLFLIHWHWPYCRWQQHSRSLPDYSATKKVANWICRHIAKPRSCWNRYKETGAQPTAALGAKALSWQLVSLRCPCKMRSLEEACVAAGYTFPSTTRHLKSQHPPTEPGKSSTFGCFLTAQFLQCNSVLWPGIGLPIRVEAEFPIPNSEVAKLMFESHPRPQSTLKAGAESWDVSIDGELQCPELKWEGSLHPALQVRGNKKLGKIKAHKIYQLKCRNWN